MTMDGKIAVLGSGAWGTALACVMSRTGSPVSLWGRDDGVVADIMQNRRNSKYLGDIALDSGFVASGDLAAVVHDASVVLLAVPAQTVHAMADRLKPVLADQTTLVCCAKGIDRESGLLPAEILENGLPGARLAALSGPSFASDVARGLPTAITLAAWDLQQANALSAKLSSAHFRCYASDDLRGVELGGALKNVLALAVGAVRGMKLGASAEAALVARGFAEMMRLSRAMGGRPETLTGLSGLGDLVLTCSGPQSRNFAYGMAMATGADLSSLPLAEGAFTARIASTIANREIITIPVRQAVADVIDGCITALQAVMSQLERPLKPE